MNRLEQTLSTLKQNGKKAFVTFTMAGDPNRETCLSVLDGLAEYADIIEIGIPFSDPMADGPVIQAAGLRALNNGTNIKSVFEIVQKFRSKNNSTPVILMGYINPVLRQGADVFCMRCRDAGVDGLIIVDMPPEETAELSAAIEQNDLRLIRLVTPTTGEARLETILNGAGGFLYYVSINGVTGTATADPKAVKKHIERVKQHTHLPVMAGFGIKNAADVGALRDAVDGVIVGSAFVSLIAEKSEKSDVVPDIKALAAELRGALDTQKAS